MPEDHPEAGDRAAADRATDRAVEPERSGTCEQEREDALGDAQQDAVEPQVVPDPVDAQEHAVGEHVHRSGADQHAEERDRHRRVQHRGQPRRGDRQQQAVDDAGQVEHNIFTTKPAIYSWFINQFERKWNNLGGVVENVDFVPLPPDAPRNPVPAVGATNVSNLVRLTWFGGPWAHLYDVYLDTNPNPTTPIALNLAEPLSKNETSTFSYSHPLFLRTGTTYYWRVVGKTMALQGRASPVWSFKTAGCPPPAGRLQRRLPGRPHGVPAVGWRVVRSTFARQLPLRGVSELPVGAPDRSPGRRRFRWRRATRSRRLPSLGRRLVIRYSSTGFALDQWAYFQWGTATDIPIAADFDGDGTSDLVFYRPSNGGWYIRYSSRGYATNQTSYYQWGLPTDIPIAADFDGDGRTDLTVYRPSDGTWNIRYSSRGWALNQWVSFQWGLATDKPLVADFDGDGRTDLTFYRPSDGGWYFRFSSLGYDPNQWAGVNWGLATDIPIAADFDGDRRTELAVFRPSDGTWYIRYSSAAYSTAYSSYQWGLRGDLPIVR